MGRRHEPALAADFGPKTALVTVICDASFSDQTRCGGWAGRVIYDGLRFTFSGPIRARLNAALEAEIAAVANTLLAASQGVRLPRGPSHGWLLQSDNEHTVRTVNHFFQDRSNRTWPSRPPSQSPNVQKAVAVITEVAALHMPKFILARHVKGHVAKKDRDPKHHVQETMDQLAKAERITWETLHFGASK